MQGVCTCVLMHVDAPACVSKCVIVCVHTCVHVHGYSVCEVSRNECVYVWYVCGCASVMRIL